MIFAFEFVKPLDGGYVFRLGNYANNGCISSRIRAYFANLVLAKRLANTAKANAFLCFLDCIRKLRNVRIGLTQNVKRQPLRGFRADTGKFFELCDKFRKRLVENHFRMGSCPAEWAT